MFSFHYHQAGSEGGAWYSGYREKVTLNVKSAIEFGDQLFEQVKERPSRTMIELRRGAAHRLGPGPGIRKLSGGSIVIEQQRRPLPALDNELSEEDILSDGDPSLP